MFTIRHEFYEKASGYAYPIVAHEFTGQSLEEARSYFHTHLRFDRMLRDISALGHNENGASGIWKGIQFRSVVRIIRK